MKELDSTQVVGYVKSLGFNVFYGYVEYPFSIVVSWDRSKGDLKDFLRVAKMEAVKLILLDWLDLDDEMIDRRKLEPTEIQNPDERERITKRNETLESYRKNVGKTVTMSVSWVRDGVRYLYTEAADWWPDFRDILDEVDEESGEEEEEEEGE